MEATANFFKIPCGWKDEYKFVKLEEALNYFNISKGQSKYEQINVNLFTEVQNLGFHRALPDSFFEACLLLELHDINAYFKEDVNI
jgi:hypothetical protein